MILGNRIARIRQAVPLVHCITNYVTVNDCANAVLAIGGSPIMSDEEKDVEDIIAICSALTLNIGTLNERTVSSMILAGKKANELGKPVILDPVGNGASRFRTQTTNRILEEVKVDILRGNSSEMKMVYSGVASTRGVDASKTDADSLENQIMMVKDLSAKLDLVVGMTGPVDVVSDGNLVYTISNGSPMMEHITGAGCMLSCVVGAFAGVFENQLEATTAAIAAMGLAGDRADVPGVGTGTFRMNLIDQLSWMDDATFHAGVHIEQY